MNKKIEMGDQSRTAESKKLETQRSSYITRMREIRNFNRKSEGKSKEAINLESQKSHLKENRFSRKISVANKRSMSPEKKKNVENTVIDIEPFGEVDYSEKLSKEISQSTRNPPALRRSENVSFSDIEAAEDDTQKLMPVVVVDVHCEKETVKPLNKSFQKPFFSERKTNTFNLDQNNKKDKEQGKLFTKSPKRRELKTEDPDIIRDDDFIQELREESPLSVHSLKSQAFSLHAKESRTDLRKSLQLSMEEKSENEEKTDSAQPSSAQKTRRRKRWEKLETVYLSDDLKKVQKKRWSQNVVRFVERKSINSLDNSPEKEDSPKSPIKKIMMQEEIVKPIPAPRTKSNKFLKESHVAFDNKAFISDQEEVLRIETNQENAKVKMILETVDIKTDEKSNMKEIKGLRDKRMEPVSSARSETSDLDSEDHRVQNKNKSPENIQVLDNSEDKSDIREKESFTIKKMIRSKTFRKTSRSENSSNLGNESSISQNSKREIQSRRNSEEISSEDENSQKSSKSKIQVIHFKYSGQETTVSTNEDSDRFLDRSKSKSKTRDSKNSEEGEEREKRRKKDFRKSRTCSATRTQESFDEDTAKKRKRKKKRKKEEKNEIKFISIIVHRSDVLEVDYITRHPMVKVHIVNINTGEYLRNQESGEKTKKSYLQPVITGKFDFREHRSMIPIWEEELIFEHDFDDILKTGDDQVLILFEVVDLLTFSEASYNYDHYGSEGCWYKIAWAFLRPVGTVGLLHINKKVRLQLYRPKKNFKKFGRNKCEVYTWWKSNKRETYPSSLFVTVSAVEPPKLKPIYYEQLTFNEISDVKSDVNVEKAIQKSSDEISLPKWSRLTAQSCKIPNELLFETEVSSNGSFYLAFSNDGKFIAITASEEYEFPITVYKLDERKIYVQFSGHKNFVYALNWSQNDQYLLSVSSDQTARLWDVNEKIVQHIQLLPHPSYVYCGKFDPANSSIVVTGCYDHITRIWVEEKNSKTYELVQELEVHEGFVNSICFQNDGSFLTADSVGVIILWIVKKNRRSPIKKEWQIAKKIKIKEIEGVPINTIILHPRGSRLLVHSRNNGLRLLDLATEVVLQRYEGLENRRIQIAACISPCAGLIFCGGEDATLNVWNLETGKHLAKYTINDNYSSVTCVDYHPYDHVLAFSTFGNPASVKLLKFDKDSSGENVGLKILVNVKTVAFTNSDVSLHTLENSRTKELWRSSSKRRNLEESIDVQPSNSGESINLPNFRGSTGQLIENEESDTRKENLKIKLQRFMESGPNLKTRSMNRLNNIIEKIDKILLNASTSKSPDDLEAAFGATQNQNMALITMNPNLERSRRKSKAIIYQNSNDISNSTPTDEGFEMQTFTRERKYWKERSRSAKPSSSPKRRIEEDFTKTFSDSAVICRGRGLIYSEKLSELNSGDNPRKSILNGVQNVQRKDQSSSSSGSVVMHQYSYNDQKRSETPDSDGTYVVEKSDLEKNQDANPREIFGSGSSARSNVTFTIVSEVPAPKPRKKKLLVQ